MQGQFKFLFSPLKIGQVVVPNRISFSAHLTSFAEDCLPSERHAYYYAARARGGTGLIITEEQSVHPTDRAYEKLIEAFRPEAVAGYKKITRAVHAYETRIFAQINHNGQQCSGALSRLPVWAPSAVPDPVYREVPKEMEIEDIEEVIRYFDTVVAAMGNTARDDLYFALKGKVKELYRAGDCVAPRKADMAIHEGYAAGRRV
jgi:2,4-dienoyl-CoA reductase-like NADH-dependent reductase (Old Yellow Enzyme family)